MSSVVKSVKKGVKSVGRRVKGALKGDLSDLTSIFTGGASDLTKNIFKGAAGALTPQLPELPAPLTAADIAAAIPEPATPGAVQGSIGTTVPDIDLTATESQRRRLGTARGSRKLKVPLGGLR